MYQVSDTQEQKCNLASIIVVPPFKGVLLALTIFVGSVGQPGTDCYQCYKYSFDLDTVSLSFSELHYILR